MLTATRTSNVRSNLRRTRSRGWSVIIESAVTRGRVPREAIRRVVESIRHKGARGRQVRVIMVGDSHMRRLNRNFRGKNTPTDVLAFPWGDSYPSTGEVKLIGEVYCNYDHARRWSHEHGGKITDELARLAVHGCLHLLGFDHHRPADRKRMALAENRCLKAAGLLAFNPDDFE
jgi:probable rRNA maturation factor